MSVHIVQCLCPLRHCIMAFAYEPGITAAGGSDQEDVTLTPENAPGVLRDIITRATERHWLNPWCGICKSREFIYEDGATKYATIEEARPHILELEAANARARSVFGQPAQN